MLREEGESVPQAFLRHQKQACEEANEALAALIPEGFREHGRVAKREFLLSFKVILQGLADKVEAVAAAEEDRPDTTGKTKIKVEVS
jgi:hypothetical protein